MNILLVFTAIYLLSQGYVACGLFIIFYAVFE